MSGEPIIRALVGKAGDGGVIVTSLVSIDKVPHLNKLGWQFVVADPEDLQRYLAWLYQRETETE